MEENNSGELGVENELRQKVALAARVAQSAPGLETTAFEKVLDHLLKSVGAVNEPGPGGGVRQRTTSARKPVKTKPEELDRIRTILEAPAEVVSENSTWLLKVQQKHQVYGMLRIARDRFSINGMTLPELRAMTKTKFRLGIADGSLARILSTAPPSEIGRDQSSNGQTVYSLMQPGDAALEVAIAKASQEEKA